MRLALATLAAAALAACSPSGAPAEETVAPETPPVEIVEAEALPAETAEAAQVNSMDVIDPYVALPAPGRDVSGGFLSLTVTGKPMRLESATCTFAETVELHTMSMDDGVMKMRKVPWFDITEEAPLELKRGGNHLMFFGMDPELAAGDTGDIVLMLTDADGNRETLIVEAEIRDFGE